MQHCKPLIIAVSLCLLATLAYAQTIDNFNDGNIDAWNVTAPYYTTLTVVSPGSGGTGKALAITETSGSAHSQSALAHRVFSSPQDWSAYPTLQLDAKINSGADWDGFSIKIYNNGKPVVVRGIHGDSTNPDFQTFKFDISSLDRSQITEIVIYVNRTLQNAGQTLTIDNIMLSATPVSIDDSLILNDFTSFDVSRWQDPLSHVYNTSAAAATESDDHGGVVEITRTGTSTSAYAHWTLTKTDDWTDYNTLQFDVKAPGVTKTDGYSFAIYNQGTIFGVTDNANANWGTRVKIKKFIPGITDYAVIQIDISDIERDQVSSLLWYVNRMGTNNTTLRMDNFKLLRSKIAPSPDEVLIDNFDSYADNTALATIWNSAYNCTLGLNTTDFLSVPNSFDITLSGTSSSSYTKYDWTVNNGVTQDWEDYKTLRFDAQIIKSSPTLDSYPVGFSANIVNGVGGGNVWFYPTRFSTGDGDWITTSIDISSVLDREQVKWLRIYTNRCHRDDVGQIVRIDNIRLTKETTTPPVYNNPNVDDFEDSDISDWYYKYKVTNQIVTDPTTNSSVLKITNTQNDGTSAYTKKMLEQDWSSYKTLQFDARVANSSTSQGFACSPYTFAGGQASKRYFYPTNQWKTYYVDISDIGTNLSEVTGLFFYVNTSGQNGSQELYIDNIKLSKDPASGTFDTIGAAKQMADGYTVTFNSKIVTAAYDQAMPDPNGNLVLKTVLFLEESDSSSNIGYSGITVLQGANEENSTYVQAGDEIKITGKLATLYGIRYIDAINIDILSQYNDIPKPVALANKALTAGTVGMDSIMPNSSGLDNTGMLVMISGRVVAAGTPNKYNFKPCIYIDDGSNVTADNGAVGVKVYDFGYSLGDPSYWVGKYVICKGYTIADPEFDSTSGNPTGKAVRAIWLDLNDYTPIREIQ